MLSQPGMACPFTVETARTRLQLLENLVHSLPEDLPLNDSEGASFALDPDSVVEEGYTYALNQCFECVWGYKNNGLRITERGTKLLSTLAIFDEVIPMAEDIGIIILWVDALIQAAVNAGATRYVSVCVYI